MHKAREAAPLLHGLWRGAIAIAKARDHLIGVSEPRALDAIVLSSGRGIAVHERPTCGSRARGGP